MQIQTACANNGDVSPTHDQIALLAYQLHQNAGGNGQGGQSVDDWLCAEYFLKSYVLQNRGGTSTSPPLPSGPATASPIRPTRKVGRVASRKTLAEEVLV